MISALDVVEHSGRLSEQASAAVTQKKPGTSADVNDEDSCLKLDLRALDQNVSPRAATVAADSARTLADIPEDYLMSASARTAATDELSVGAGTQRASSRLDAAQVPSSSHAVSVASQSVDVKYSEDFSASSAAGGSRGATSQKPSETSESKLSHVEDETVKTEADVSSSPSAASEKPSQTSRDAPSQKPAKTSVSEVSQTSHDAPSQKPAKTSVSEESIRTEADVSEALSEDEMLTSAVELSHEASSPSTSDKAASLSKSAAAAVINTFTVSPGDAGKCYRW